MAVDPGAAVKQHLHRPFAGLLDAPSLDGMSWERVRSLLRLLPALARDSRIPRPLRWLVLIGLLPIPGPVDEAVGLAALGLIALFYRPVLREVRSRAADSD